MGGFQYNNWVLISLARGADAVRRHTVEPPYDGSIYNEEGLPVRQQFFDISTIGQVRQNGLHNDWESRRPRQYALIEVRG